MEASEIVETPAPVELENLDAINDLLNGSADEIPAEPVPAEAPETDEAANPEPPEKAGLDYGLKVPMPDGTSATLGELKDAWQNTSSSTLNLIERENAVLRDREQASLLLSYINELPDHVVQAAKTQAVTSYAREMELLTQSIPESKTPEGQRAMKERIYSLADEYGVPHREIDKVQSAVTIKMLNDFARLKADIKAARGNVKPLRSADAKPTQGKASIPSAAQALAQNAARSRSSSDEALAVAALLKA